ncbi:hypothetical protein HP550_02185 [Cellulomonas humilata]|uniref:DUF5666 domain-containing protein n=1 Tax=Cellulomonas humilata TaxID=144055 RepID=A0A7Y6DWC1_9CELL|nr:DUF5666 domain-containing protein [Cellulomonas humilata]NUU16060.1 hypothetical protein [Cellulomonas humilata]
MSTLTTRLLPAIAAASVLVLAGCSAGTSQAAAPTASATPQQQQDGGGAQPPGGGGASGEIATVTGTVMQVRSDDAQTAVTWTDATTFSATVAGTLADVTVGSCVVAVSTATTDDTTDTSAPVEATSIRITQPSDDGTCAGGFGGFAGGPGGGDRPDGAPTDLPSMRAPDGAPTDLPSGAPDGARMFGGGASGTVTAIDGSTLTVETTGPDDATTSRTVTVTDATTYTTTAAADASAMVVGQCATARGEADDSGKVTATSITVSAPTDGDCTTGMLGGRGFPGGGSQGSSDDSSQDGDTDA